MVSQLDRYRKVLLFKNHQYIAHKSFQMQKDLIIEAQREPVVLRLKERNEEVLRLFRATDQSC